MRDVHAALRNPDDVFKDIEHDALIAIREVDGKHAIVAYVREDEVIKVVTVLRQ